MKSLLLFLMLVKLGEQQDTVLEGDVYVEGIFSLYESENSECDTVNPFSVQVMEAVKWIYQSLNEKRFLDGIKIGLKVHRTCRSTSRATDIVFDVAKNIDGTRKDTVAILGPQYSSEAIQISRLLSSLPESVRLLQISHSATASSLGDHSVYNNFFRTIPSSDLQVKTMLSFMQQVNWTYVAIIHDDDTYGREAAAQLLSDAGRKYTCFPEVFPVDPGLTKAQMYQQLERNIISLRSRSIPISGVVLFGGFRLENTVLEIINNLVQNVTDYEVPKILVSEGFSTVKQVPRGLFMATPPIRKIVEFEEYWMSDLLGNISAIANNAYLSDIYRQLKGCDISVSGINCDPLTDEEIRDNFPQPFIVHYAVQAALSIAKAIKLVHTNRCSVPSISVDDCRELLIDEPKINYLRELEGTDVVVNFDADFGNFRIKAFQDANPDLILNFTKQSSNPAYVSADVVTYVIYNIQLCTGQFCMKEVLEYREAREEFLLNYKNLRDYDPRTGEEIMLSDIKKPQCPPNSTCAECQVSTADDLDVTQGDLYIVGIAPVHGKSDSPIQCGPIKMGGFDCGEAIKYQIEHEMKASPGKIPNAKIGSIIIDSCNDPQWITEKIVNLHRQGIYKDGKYEPVKDKIIGYVGSWISDASIAVAEILTRLKKVQISYASTSPRLSNRTLYPYFMRVVQNDENQGKEMLKIVKDFGSDFVQVLYSPNAYGIGGMESIYTHAKDYGICISQAVVCPEDKTYNLSKIKEALMIPGNPKIIISFLSSFDVVRLLKTLNELKGYVIVASEAWGNRDLLDDAYNLNGSITLANELPISSNFREHMKNMRVNRTLNQPWLQEYMEENFECYFEWEFHKPANRRQCGPEDYFNPSLENDGFKIETWVPFAAIAVQSLLYGAAEALDEACGFSHALCDNFTKTPEILIRHIKTLNLPYDGISSKKVFDSNGDGLIAYNRYQITKKGNGKVEYVEFREDNPWKWPHSVCDQNNDACNRICHTAGGTDATLATVEKENSGVLTAMIVLAIVVVILLALFIFCGIAFRQKTLIFKVKEDPYLTPGYVTSVTRDADGEMIST